MKRKEAIANRDRAFLTFEIIEYEFPSSILFSLSISMFLALSLSLSLPFTRFHIHIDQFAAQFIKDPNLIQTASYLHSRYTCVFDFRSVTLCNHFTSCANTFTSHSHSHISHSENNAQHRFKFLEYTDTVTLLQSIVIEKNERK